MGQRRSNGGGGKRQAGQVMPMTAILIVAVLLSLWAMYDSGQLMTERMKLQNTADNVAYSGSALVARDLNYAAYTNRAMVANQVAIGQMVGLSSWAAMMEQFGTNIGIVGKVATVVPYVGPLINALAQTFEKATEALASTVDAAVKIAIPLNDGIIRALSASQNIFHMGMSATLMNFSEDIAQANDPDVEQVLTSAAGSVQAFVEWQEQIGRFSKPNIKTPNSTTNQRFDDFAEVVGDSRDPFTARRSYEMGPPMSGFFWDTQKRGGSDLKRSTGIGGVYQWDWTAMDTVGFEAKFKVFGKCIVCVNVPLGWGAAHALQGSGSYYNYSSGSGWGGAWDNSTAALYASGSQAGHNLRNTSGLQPFYAFRDDGAPNSGGPGLLYLFRKDNSSMPLTADLGAQGDNPLNTEAGEGFITAAAKGQPHYSRPTDIEQFARHDGNFEYGNLYNPFWQPRIVKLNNTERALLLTGTVALGN